MEPSPTVTNQTPVPPVRPPVHGNTLRRTIVLVVLAAVLILLIGLGIVFRNEIMSAYALRDVRVSEAQYRDITVQGFSLFGLRTEKIISGVTGDYTSVRGVRAAIVSNNDGTQDTVLLSDNNRTLTTDGLRKAALALSPDGTKLAYAALTELREGEQAVPFTGRWTVRIVDLATGESMDLGLGFAPEFFSRDGADYLLYTTPTQLTIFDIAKKSASGTDFFTPSSVDYTARISEDGTYLTIRSAVTGKFDVFTVDSIEGRLALSPVGTVDTQLTDTQWVGDTLYGLTEPADGTVSVIAVDPKDTAFERVAGTFNGTNYYRFIR